MNKYGEVQYHKLTEEPSMILWQFRHFSLVRRPIMGQAGISYKFALLLNSELETLQEQTARTVAQIQARNSVAEAEFGQGLGASMPTLPFKKSN